MSKFTKLFKGFPIDELIIGALFQGPLIWITNFWVGLGSMLLGAILWSLGGWEHGNKLFRMIGATGLTCGLAALFIKNPYVLIAIPFMVWVSPFSYGKSAWLYRFVLKHFVIQDDTRHADLITRLVTFSWYWGMLLLAAQINVIVN